ncbi:hypothetical protein BC833DRAFT_602978 [Globomyces pollinis-pini]|nr:hypothetical protein BC833DRAFT_602978 [Globomyces pollinis-pini]
MPTHHFKKPKTVKERFNQWKSDLDRTQGYELESRLARHFDKLELKNINLSIKKLEKLKLNQNCLDLGDITFPTQQDRQFAINMKLKYYSNSRDKVLKTIKENEDSLQSWIDAKNQQRSTVDSYWTHFWKSNWKSLKNRFKKEPVYVNPPNVQGILIRSTTTKSNDIEKICRIKFADTVQEIIFDADDRVDELLSPNSRFSKDNHETISLLSASRTNSTNSEETLDSTLVAEVPIPKTCNIKVDTTTNHLQSEQFVEVV